MQGGSKKLNHLAAAKGIRGEEKIFFGESVCFEQVQSKILLPVCTGEKAIYSHSSKEKEELGKDGSNHRQAYSKKRTLPAVHWCTAPRVGRSRRLVKREENRVLGPQFEVEENKKEGRRRSPEKKRKGKPRNKKRIRVIDAPKRRKGPKPAKKNPG